MTEDPLWKSHTSGGDVSHGPRMQGGRLERIDFSTLGLGQIVRIGVTVAAIGAVATIIGGAVVLTFPANG